MLVFKLDRLGRDTRLILNSVDVLEKCGVRVRSGTEEFDTQSARGRLMLTMLSGFAAHEREQIRERSMAGTNRKAAEGAWLGGIIPFGYRKEGTKGRGAARHQRRADRRTGYFRSRRRAHDFQDVGSPEDELSANCGPSAGDRCSMRIRN